MQVSGCRWHGLPLDLLTGPGMEREKDRDFGTELGKHFDELSE
jgi:hypothetical protein